MIPHIIQKALGDVQEWIAARQAENIQHDISSLQAEQRATLHSIAELLQLPYALFCFVDGSWKSQNERAVLAWKVVNKEGVGTMMGSTSIDSIANSLEMETMWRSLEIHNLCTTISSSA